MQQDQIIYVYAQYIVPDLKDELQHGLGTARRMPLIINNSLHVIWKAQCQGTVRGESGIVKNILQGMILLSKNIHLFLPMITSIYD